jgi:serine/threonine-protein kinase
MQRLEVAVRLDPNRGSSVASLLDTRALLGDEAHVRSEIARYRDTPMNRSLLPLFIELAAWWDDRTLAVEAADGIERAKSGAAWEQAVPLLRAFAAGDTAGMKAIAERLFGGAVAGMAPWQVAKRSSIAATWFLRAGEVEKALQAIETVAVQPTFLHLLWLDRMPLLAPLRADPRFAAARAIVAARVADLGL